mgnify:CR=1 FL=1
MEKTKAILKQIAFLKQLKGFDTKRRIQKLQQKLDNIVQKYGRNSDTSPKT